jgi:DNA invertase Pin-like site-specific DNA recombinase
VTDVPAALRGPAADWEPWIGYIRVSTWREEAISPEIQQAAIEAWAARTRRRILKPYVTDLDMTGRNFKRKVMGAIEAVERGEARGIAVWRFSRFGRTDVGVRVNLARLEDAGGQLASATEDIDVSNAVGRFNRRILLDLAAFESERIGEEWQSTHAIRLANGVPSGGRPRFGYLWTPRRVPDAESPTGWRLQPESYDPLYPVADALAEAYEQYVTGTGFVTLAAMLNDLGCKTTRGGTWRQDSLLKYMDSGFAAGLLRVRDSCDCGKGGRSHKSCAHWRAFPGAHDPIITPEVWTEYRARRALVRTLPPRVRTPTHDTTGLVHCSLCAGSLSGHRKDADVYWRCAKADAGGDCDGSAATGSDLDLLVLAFLADTAEGVDRAPAAPVREPHRPDATATRVRLTAEHEAARDALTRLVVDYARNPSRYPGEAFDGARAALEADRDRIMAELAKLEPEPARLPTMAELRPLALGLLEEWEVRTPQQRNGVLRQLVREVRVYPRRPRTVTRARIVPVWEPLETVDPGPTDLSSLLEAIPDGIAYKTAELAEARERLKKRR